MKVLCVLKKMVAVLSSTKEKPWRPGLSGTVYGQYLFYLRAEHKVSMLKGWCPCAAVKKFLNTGSVEADLAPGCVMTATSSVFSGPPIAAEGITQLWVYSPLWPIVELNVRMASVRRATGVRVVDQSWLTLKATVEMRQMIPHRYSPIASKA